MSNCPNKNHPDWIKLVNEVGEFEAYRQFIANGDKINSENKNKITESYTSENKEKVKNWFDNNLPQYNPQWIDDILEVNGNRVDAWGYFKDNIIKVLSEAPKGTAYHEAFHAVFRNLLNNNEKESVINEAKEKYGIPNTEELDNLNSMYNNKLSNESLMWLYYEEKLADDFAEYRLNQENKNLLDKIKDFFNKILRWFNIVTLTNTEELFDKIDKGYFKSVDNVDVIVNNVSNVYNEPAYKKIEGFTSNEKNQRVDILANKFIAKYYQLLSSGSEVNPSKIFEEIYKEYINIAKDAKINTSKYDNNSILYLVKFLKSYNDFVKEAKKNIESKGLTIKSNIELNLLTSDNLENNEFDEEVLSMESKTTKSYGQELVEIPGIRSASTRLKLFLNSIPVRENGEIKTDILGDIIYHDFYKLYYYLERNLTGIYDYQSQLDQLEFLAISRPEINDILERLNNKQANQSEEEFNLLKNDFKTNFSKQQLAFTLVLYDNNNSDGTVTYKVIDANRQDISREITNEWDNNLLRVDKNTISEYNKDNEVTYFNTKKSKDLKNKFQTTTDKFKFKFINDILNSLGIEFSTEVLDNLVREKDSQLITNINTLLNYYNSESPDKLEKEKRLAIASLVNMEVSGRLDRYTSSFNNVEKKSIYTVQLPSYASKIISKLTSKNEDTVLNIINELKKGSLLKHSNFIKLLEEDTEFRKEFKLTYLDGLKDERGFSDGSKFTKMSPKDFLALSIALFQNTSINENKVNTRKIGKYIYLTPSDKTMSMIFDMPIYDVNFVNNKIVPNSEIINKFYNVVLAEAERIKNQLLIKDKVLKGELSVEKLKLYYHYKKGSDLKAFDGAAYKFNIFDSLNNLDLTKLIEENINLNVKDILAKKRQSIINNLLNELNQLVYNSTQDAIKNNLIQIENGVIINKGIDVNNFDSNIIGKFELNQLLANIELSILLNGDVAFYKPNDLGKRTYQSGSMTVLGNNDNQTIKTIVVKDIESSSPYYDNWVDTLIKEGYSKEKSAKIIEDYLGTNVTDAQVLVHPDLYRKIHINRGTWNNELQTAFDIAEGIITNVTKEQLEQAHLKLSSLKPFYFGHRFDSNINEIIHEQVKTAMFPLFKSFINNNDLYKEKRKQMDDTGLEMIAFESSFKATMSNRYDIDTLSNNDIINNLLELDMNNFGIQVDNPDHLFESDNSSLRQVKMLLIGSIDPLDAYNGILGSQIISDLDNLESTNILEDLNDVIDKIGTDKFKDYLIEQLTKRNTTENIQEALEIKDGKFSFPLDFGPYSTSIENMISSVFTNRIIKQEFEGGAAVQITSLGFKNQKDIDNNQELSKLQTTLKHVRNVDDKIEYAEAIMPAWTSKFFNEDGTLKDIENIPDNLKELFVYRIPTEGYHSMLHVKVVGFMPKETGNFMLLPYEITTQFGADFDFDKVYFINPEFYESKGNLIKYEYLDDNNSTIEDRYNQYKQYQIDKNKEVISLNDFSKLDIFNQNVKAARNNKILSNYINLLEAKQNFKYLITPSGFKKLAEMKSKIEKESSLNKTKNLFFSGLNQRDLKYRNHLGIGLKGQSANHVTGHSYGILLGLKSKEVFKFDNKESNDLDALKNEYNELITDELSSMMAAILDDIKNPLMATIGINDFTIDMFATIVRAGYGIETAINFITQPSIVELSYLLASNKNQLKEVGQGYYNIDTILDKYNKIYYDIKKYAPEYEINKITEEEKYLATYNLNNKDMERWRKFSKDIDVNNLSKENIESNPSIIYYYQYQIKVLNNYKRYDAVAKALVKINRFLGVNKEVGPSIEDINEKNYIFEDIYKESFKIVITKEIESLNSYFNSHNKALDYFNDNFPYSTNLYNFIKQRLVEYQYKYSGGSLGLIPKHKRSKINKFISYYLDNKGFKDYNQLKDISNESFRLFTEFTKLVDDIKNINNDKYKNLRKNPFIENIRVIKNKKSKGIQLIELKGNKLDVYAKNLISEGLEDLYRNPETKELALDFIKYSFVSSGFFTGIKSYHDLIPVSILKDLNFDKVRFERLIDLKDGSYFLTTREVDYLIDKIIRNFSNDFTKVVDVDTFDTDLNNPYILITNINKIISNNQTENVLINNDEYLIKPVEYLRVYIKNDTKLYKLEKYNEDGSYIEYKEISKLGMKGKMIELNDKSIIEDILLSNEQEDSNNEYTSFEDIVYEDLDEEQKQIMDKFNNLPDLIIDDNDSQKLLNSGEATDMC